jgi:hypothetical protein
MQVLTTAPDPPKFGHQVLCSDYTTNVPVFSNFGLSPQELLPHRPSRRAPSRPSHVTMPTTAPVNGSTASPAISHGTTPNMAPGPAAPNTTPKCTAAAGDTRHTATFMFTDGDSLTWDLGNFASPAYDWWGSKWRGTVPIAWTFQPVLQELHPYFLRWVHLNATTNDTLLVGPSGAGYTYLDRYPDGPARARFGAWTSDNIERSGLLNMINQIQVWATFDSAVEHVQACMQVLTTAPAHPKFRWVPSTVQWSSSSSRSTRRPKPCSSTRRCDPASIALECLD